MDDSETAFPRSAERITARRATRVPERGFTLIELMIVVAIIGILSAIAYPSYRDHVIRGNLVDATDALSSMQADMERYFQDRRTYAEVSSGSNKFIPPCAPAATATATATTAGRTIGNFVLSCASVSASGYTLQAAGNTNSVVERFNFTVNQQNVRTTTSPWGNCASAWILRKGQAC